MRAGRELDRMVHEHVMDLPTAESCVNIYWDGELGRLPVGHYSTRISDAWKVVEGLEKVVHLIRRTSGSYVVRVGTHTYADGQQVAEAETAPLAICLAALRAVGYEDLG